MRQRHGSNVVLPRRVDGLGVRITEKRIRHSARMSNTKSGEIDNNVNNSTRNDVSVVGDNTNTLKS